MHLTEDSIKRDPTVVYTRQDVPDMLLLMRQRFVN